MTVETLVPATAVKPNEISITQALAELKRIDGRIAKATASLSVVSLGYQTPATEDQRNRQATFNTTAKGDYESVLTLIKRRNTIKGLIVQSNAATKVEIGSVEYTVATAIETKASIKHYKDLLLRLKADKMAAERRFVSEEATFKARLDAYVTGQAKELKKTEDADWIGETTKNYSAANAPAILDPIKIDEAIVSLSNMIEEFEMNVDVALTMSNSTTFIRV